MHVFAVGEPLNLRCVPVDIFVELGDNYSRFNQTARLIMGNQISATLKTGKDEGTHVLFLSGESGLISMIHVKDPDLLYLYGNLQSSVYDEYVGSIRFGFEDKIFEWTDKEWNAIFNVVDLWYENHLIENYL